MEEKLNKTQSGLGEWLIYWCSFLQLKIKLVQYGIPQLLVERQREENKGWVHARIKDTPVERPKRSTQAWCARGVCQHRNEEIAEDCAGQGMQHLWETDFLGGMGSGEKDKQENEREWMAAIRKQCVQLVTEQGSPREISSNRCAEHSCELKERPRFILLPCDSN